ncbi:hypothetical protein A2631_00565 [Candidatus Daviesbacteria bacterium RIFCSPHIGHO2_01_FULL_44_29]|uniref:Uncharacterized protein n=1 Tax=Candidatus Daviesbacteria bacterium RIFCSPHIGHO2_02_FULL_43_12 TaxID=1797776 RepID=A0A1F5KHF1_9BACT|nr:MAG: hypothetical protein A2631_00565 [Candidatus Daviesbacteria bacterium RIFCSPHIGHO2_01_FULL_44_29]OGE39443.1 MAG: hypothetical protein A3E86_01495 [Candidatus Daviesbacteria bacterium RIFCSPHIGHO2_12_FULL_47_45]OGE40342.1 MAG: hypothetical protein A3D25_03095 [Candidatus Daviesbacteria bacterium RIFCSPHIGHO2_02_FULL_43_12]OGE69739.1 MAG: hypothetical protein A3B55_02110 [Candidatus Daviesbacteria bacterium RIFCSPLOWO2_01_FULL_43_15]
MEPYRIKRLTFSAGVASDFSGAVDRSTHQLTAVIIAANLLSEVPINGEIDKGAMQLVAALSNRKFTPEQMTQLKATLRS